LIVKPLKPFLYDIVHYLGWFITSLYNTKWIKLLEVLGFKAIQALCSANKLRRKLISSRYVITEVGCNSSFSFLCTFSLKSWQRTIRFYFLIIAWFVYIISKIWSILFCFLLYLSHYLFIVIVNLCRSSFLITLSFFDAILAFEPS
jgi:hypothetical protein